MTLSDRFCPVKQECVEDELLSDGSLVLYHGLRRQVLTLNPTAALVWECCDGTHDTDAIVAEVREVFPGASGINRDVRTLLDSLLQADVIGSGATPDPSGA